MDARGCIKGYRRGVARKRFCVAPQMPDDHSDADMDQSTITPSTFSQNRCCLSGVFSSKMKIAIEAESSKAERRAAMLREVSIACVLFGVVCTCYIVYQYIQELLMRIPVIGSEKFDYPVFLVFTCFAVNLLTTSILMGGMQIKMNRDHKISMSTEQRKTVFDMLDWKIGCLGLLAATSNVLAMTSSLVAIKYIGVPTQIVIKSAKMIPILIGGFILFRKKYPIYDYVAVVAITIWIFMFNYFKPNSKMDGENTPFGLAMCFLSLFMDGVTGPIEDKMLALKDLHPYLLLFILNFFGFPVIMCAALIVEGFTPIRILLDNPQLWGYVVLLSATASIGQVFIILCLKLYGSLYTTLITTIRKIVSSLLSIYMFKHKMSVMQWISMSGTFATLFARQYVKYKFGAKKKGQQEASGH